ncbi:RluA family pseudouridine synthase [Enterobacteriaceae endosymbiont of Donacia bicoloricornis]|uniref:RluA family pseudouridine synthase n=1 Tax=Enterobacteriaceae endosymbiont of Donacia bicoloricornis TaxID=2675772 RepID=UPI00144A1899|nr:RluA family pseudouridine synthase [Enterobacteriaceae endosymbiont of Donacia bicoloricornis]QJC37618.1 RluA family pseudouridine synthase [Enterobacteriaceae endosymbiont of Donacia bicoloricornis]
MYKIINNKIIIIPSTIETQRIDNFLINKFKNVPKSRIYKMLRTGKIKVNKKKISPNFKIKSQDKIKIPFIYINKIKPVKYNITLSKIKFFKKMIIYEDKYILAINKPSGIAVHGGSGINYGIIENFRFLLKKIKFLELVHRIDKETSGVLLMAKKRTVLKILQQQLSEKKVFKEYIALVKGNCFEKKNIYIKNFLIKNFLNKKVKVKIHNNKGKYSETKFKIIKNYKNFMLIKINPLTGRTHQIRVHLSHLNYPIINDQRYGNNNLNLKFRQNFCVNRLFLHAKSIQLIHPINNKKIKIYAPLSYELSNCLLNLKQY